MRLTLRRRSARPLTKEAQELLPRQAAFLAAVTPGEAITQKEYRERYASDISERSARNDLQTLREQGYLRQTGQGYYRAYLRTEKPWEAAKSDA